MAKYIDTEKLKAEIKKLQCEQGFDTGEAESAYQFAIKDIFSIIASLQQEQPEVDLEKIVKSYFDIGHLDVRITTNGDGLLRFARRISRLVRDASFRLYNESGFGDNGGDIDSEIEATIKMNDMWGDLLPDTLIKYTARHFYELGQKAGKEAE